MPNLINVIRAARKAAVSSGAEKGMKPGSKSTTTTKINGNEDEGDGDMEWGTVLIFTCSKDCCRMLKSSDGGSSNGGEASKGWEDVQAAWKDEYVLVQWDV